MILLLLLIIPFVLAISLSPSAFPSHRYSVEVVAYNSSFKLEQCGNYTNMLWAQTFPGICSSFCPCIYSYSCLGYNSDYCWVKTSTNLMGSYKATFGQGTSSECQSEVGYTCSFKVGECMKCTLPPNGESVYVYSRYSQL